MLKSTIESVVREEVRSLLRDIPTPASVAEDLGTVLGALPPEDAVELAKALLTKLWEFIDTHNEPETTGAEGTGDKEE